MKKSTKTTPKKNSFPKQLFVQSFDDDDPYFCADAELTELDDNNKVAVYELVSVKTMKVTKELV